MNCKTFPRSTSIGIPLALVLAGSLFSSTAQAQQQATPVPADSTVRLTLGGAIRLATKQNAGVEGAQARVDAAQARVTQHRADLLPTVSAAVAERGASLNSAAAFPIDFPSAPGTPPLFAPGGSILGPLNVFDARVKVSQTLYDPAARSRIEAAKMGVTAANADVATQGDLAASAAASAYLMVLHADATYSARVADSTLAFELLGIAQDQLTAGTGVALDVTRARSQLTNARAQLIVARNERSRTRVDLARALGLPLVRLDLVDALATLPAAQLVTETSALETAAKNRKDLISLDLQAKASRQSAAAIRSERLPTVGVFADEGQSERNGRSFLPTYDWGIQLSVPIFDGNRREGRESEQISAARDLEIRARDLRAQVEADVRTATINLQSSSEVVAAARERLSLAEQEVAQARERFQAGVSGNADVINASMTLNSARTQLVDALTTYQASRVALARAQGTISTLD